MGTNFYMSTKDKSVRDKYFGYNYELTDTPDWGYEIHIAKTSWGWLPLFQKHKCIDSVHDIKEMYDTGHFIIYDEYGETYTWPEFEERVLKYNGGVKGAVPIRNEKHPYDIHGDHTPISHFDYKNGEYAHMYESDAEGYEFMNGEFS